MTDMLIPLLDHSNPENIQRFNDFCKVFFNEYDKDDKGYINKKELKEPLTEITNHFSQNSLSYYKLKLLFTVLDSSGNEKINELNQLIDTLNTGDVDEGIVNATKILDKNGDNKINFEEFKEIIKLLLYCLIDEAAESETKESEQDSEHENEEEFLEIMMMPDDDDADFIDLESLDDSQIVELFDNLLENNAINVSVEEFVCALIEEILDDFDDSIDIIELRENMSQVLQDVLIDGQPIIITDDDIEKLYTEHDINPVDVISKTRAEQILFAFITGLIDQ